jgi:hypothetical protein
MGVSVDLHQRVFTCRHVTDEGAPILQAHRDDDGDLQLLCGAEQHGEGDARAMQLGALILDHPSVVDIMELDAGQLAIRATPNDPWKIRG